LLRRERHRRASRLARRLTPSHDDRRVLLHRHGYLDPQRIWLARLAIGEVWRPFYGIFGNAHALLNYMPYHVARILKFPERRSEIAKLRSEIEEIRRTVSVRAEAV
jgi:hypothetical protein